MMGPMVPVVLATDANYAPYCSVTIGTLLEHRNPQREYAIYIFCEKTGEEYCRVLEGMAQPGVTIQCLDVSRYIDPEKLLVGDYFSIATYYRMFAPEVLPQYDKILYLDCDLVVLEDVAKLYDVDMGDNLLAAVRDRGLELVTDRETVNYVKSLGHGVTAENYFNAGVLVMNLGQFRKQETGRKCMEYLSSHGRLKWQDQDVLNIICNGQIHYLPEPWNKKQFYYDQDLHADSRRPEAWILHYVGGNKPWNSECNSASIPFYLAAEKSPYRERLLLEIQKSNFYFEDLALKKVRKGEAGLYCIRQMLKAWFPRKWKAMSR